MVNSKSINLGGNDTYMRRSAANTVMFDRNGAGTGAITADTNGGTARAANLIQGSASISLPSNAIMLTTGNNHNITLSPNGTGIVTKNLTLPSLRTISFGTSGKITNNSSNSFAFTTNAGSLTGEHHLELIHSMQTHSSIKYLV